MSRAMNLVLVVCITIVELEVLNSLFVILFSKLANITLHLLSLQCNGLFLHIAGINTMTRKDGRQERPYTYS